MGGARGGAYFYHKMGLVVGIFSFPGQGSGLDGCLMTTSKGQSRKGFLP
jgi:hypothetical protein